MAPPVSYTKTQFKDVPLFSVSFDPYDRGYLVVGGGGGENRSGVANILALLDVSSDSDIKNVAQLELSREEDSPQSLASLPTEDGLMTFAGINSSNTDRSAERNEHLRTFLVNFPQRKKDNDAGEKATDEVGRTDSGSIKFGAKESFFSPATGTKAFQRLLRLSPVRTKHSKSKRLGALATGDASKNEIVIFNATTAPPDQSSICARIEPEGGAEAIDMDFYETEGTSFSLAYCTEDKVFLYSLNYDFGSQTSKPTSEKPTTAFTIIRPAKTGPRPSLRCLRWLGSKHILLVLKNSTGGADLLVLRLEADKGTKPVVLRQSLPDSLVVAVHLEVCHLDADPATGERQIIIGVAGQHRRGHAEIHVLALDFQPSHPNPWKQVKRLYPVTVLKGPEKSWHTSNVMSLSFSNFFAPRQSPTSTMSIASTTQHIKLASVAWGGSVVVQSFPLTSTPTSPADTAEASAKRTTDGPSVRWVLSSNSLIDRVMSWSGLILAAIAVLVAAILLQSYLNLPGGSTSISSSSSILSNLQSSGAAVPPPAVHSQNPLAEQARRNAAEERFRAAQDPSGPIGADPAQIPAYAQKVSAISSAASSVASGASYAASSVASGASHAANSVLSDASSAAGSAAAGASSAASANPDADASSTTKVPIHRLRDLLHLRHQHSTSTTTPTTPTSHDPSPSPNSDPRLTHHILVSALDAGRRVVATLHEESASLRTKGARAFEEMTDEEREVWTRCLREVGEWDERLPESVLLGVLFSEWAQVVGGGIRDAVLGH